MRCNTYSNKNAGDEDCCGEGAENTKPKLPLWFTQKCLTVDILNDESALSQYLNACRQETYSALSLYHDHLKYITTVLVALLTATISIFSIVKPAEVAPDIVRIIELGGAGLMVTAALIGYFSQYILMRYHNFWVATLLYATEVHYSVGIVGFRWFENIIELLSKKNQKYQKIDRDEFINCRTWSHEHSHFWYALLISILTRFCVATAIYLGVCAPFSSYY